MLAPVGLAPGVKRRHPGVASPFPALPRVALSCPPHLASAGLCPHGSACRPHSRAPSAWQSQREEHFCFLISSMIIPELRLLSPAWIACPSILKPVPAARQDWEAEGGVRWKARAGQAWLRGPSLQPVVRSATKQRSRGGQGAVTRSRKEGQLAGQKRPLSPSSDDFPKDAVCKCLSH